MSTVAEVIMVEMFFVNYFPFDMFNIFIAIIKFCTYILIYN